MQKSAYYLCMTRLTLFPDATISCLACSCCSSSEGRLLIASTASPARSPALSAKLPAVTYAQTHINSVIQCQLGLPSLPGM